MKEIIVAIDFSKGSFHALKFAITIANTVNANILLVWVKKPNTTDSIYKQMDEKQVKNIEERFKEIIEKHKSLLKKGKIDFKVRKGKVHTEIANQAKYNDAYMIIAGTHGVSGFEEFWIGSNAYKIVTSSPCPVITIRYGFCTTKKISKIVLPIDDTMDTRQKVPFVAELAKLMKAEVHVLATQTSKVKEVNKVIEKYTEQTTKYFAENKVNFVCETRKGSNESDIIIEYAQSINAELIAIMTDQDSGASNIWLGPYAQQLVNHSPIPVLSIHPKQIYGLQAQL
ncbi:MAG: universal stress protein [Bacteroidetes bacterium]|nr:universal stress protein [Bacteroidota bacterium]